MKEPKTPSGVIAIFVPGLEDTPGWLALSRKKQDALLELSSRIQQGKTTQFLGELGQLIAIHKAQEHLAGEEMDLKGFIHANYKDDMSLRNIQRKRKTFAEFSSRVHPSVLTMMGEIASGVRELTDDAVEKIIRIAKSALGEVSAAAVKVPLLAKPVTSEGEVLEALGQLSSEILKGRQNRRAGVSLHLEEREAAKMLANAAINYIKACGRKTSNQRIKFLALSMGWVMGELGIYPDTMQIKRTELPDDIQLGVGRPRIHKKPKEAA